MIQFATKSELEAGWEKEHAFALSERGESHSDASTLAHIMARGQSRYTPHLYCGGWVIPGFGYSVERIAARYISEDNAGNPALVK